MHTASIHLNAMSLCTDKKVVPQKNKNSKEMNIYTQTVNKGRYIPKQLRKEYIYPNSKERNIYPNSKERNIYPNSKERNINICIYTYIHTQTVKKEIYTQTVKKGRYIPKQ